MTEKEVKNIALKYINKTQTNKNFIFTLCSVKKSLTNENEWAVAFDVGTQNGGVLEGPLFVIVNDTSGEPYYLG